MEEHLFGECRNAKVCKCCPPSIQEEIREYMKNKKNEKCERNMDPIDDDFCFGLGDDDGYDVAHNTTQQRKITFSGFGSNNVAEKPRQKGPMDVYLTPDLEISA
ncbi:hypothetical protein EZV62_027543 [Acer yangbiense]|uniref:Uncharacterized protein n=1 Tax=Acer yangbiense TaxID=1000413 RepID=A0A5C7GUS2_9ROSI|nr:hypothetical protein EZV62_027543 [Acer yangbiense]